MNDTRRHAGVRLGSYAAALLLVAAAGAGARTLEHLLQLADPALIFLLSVILSAVAGGLGPSLLASVASFLSYNFFFVEPRYTLTVSTPQGVVSLFVFLIVAALTSHLVARAREEAGLARRRAARMSALYAFSRDLAAAAAFDDVLRVVVGHVGTLFDTRAVILVPDRDRLVSRAAYPGPLQLPDCELDAACWAWAQGGAGDAASSMQPGQRWLKISLGTVRGQAAVLCLELPDARRTLDDDQLYLLDALAQQAALAIERSRIDVVLAEKEKTEQVIEASEDGILVLDGNGRVAHANGVACAIFGVSREHVIGTPFDDLASEQPHYLRVRQAVREVRDHPERIGERFEITAFLRGRNHHYVLRQTPFGAAGGLPPGRILVLQDVTYVRDQETQRENLVAMLAHELRTPLTSLRMAVELLRRNDLSLRHDSKELIETLHEDVLRLQDVSEQFLDLARSRAMTVELQRRRFELHDLLSRMLRLFSIQAREKGVTLEVSEQAVRPLVGDDTKLGWALSNLVANAIRYTPRGGTVRIETSSRDGEVLVAVSDTGPGIAPDEQSRVFERYAQGAGAEGAAGLGLAIVREIVQAHGGRIHLDSVLGSGTRFTLELPSE